MIETYQKFINSITHSAYKRGQIVVFIPASVPLFNLPLEYYIQKSIDETEYWLYPTDFIELFRQVVAYLKK